MTSNHHAPYVLGFTHATMAGTKGCDTARWSESQISNAAVNTFPGLVHTARQVTKVGNTRSRWPNLLRGEPSKVGLAIGTKS